MKCQICDINLETVCDLKCKLDDHCRVKCKTPCSSDKCDKHCFTENCKRHNLHFKKVDITNKYEENLIEIKKDKEKEKNGEKKKMVRKKKVVEKIKYQLMI